MASQATSQRTFQPSYFGVRFDKEAEAWLVVDAAGDEVETWETEDEARMSANENMIEADREQLVDLISEDIDLLDLGTLTAMYAARQARLARS